MAYQGYKSVSVGPVLLWGAVETLDWMPVKVHHTGKIIQNISDMQEQKQGFVHTHTQENNAVYRLIICSSLTAKSTDTAA